MGNIWEPPPSNPVVCFSPVKRKIVGAVRIWVCLKIGYIPNYSHLIGIMISKTIGFRGTLFSDKPISRKFANAPFFISFHALQLGTFMRSGSCIPVLTVDGAPISFRPWRAMDDHDSTVNYMQIELAAILSCWDSYFVRRIVS